MTIFNNKQYYNAKNNTCCIRRNPGQILSSFLLLKMCYNIFMPLSRSYQKAVVFFFWLCFGFRAGCVRRKDVFFACPYLDQVTKLKYSYTFTSH